MRDSDGMELFESYLRDVKRSSQNTISSYLRDIRQLSEYLHAHTDADLGSAEEEELCEYIDWMRSNGKSVATVSRAIASLKNFYGFLLNNHYVQHNPTGKLVPDKAKQKLPQILSSKEVELLLAQPECTDAKGYRERADLPEHHGRQFVRRCDPLPRTRQDAHDPHVSGGCACPYRIHQLHSPADDRCAG